jgi:hypothetical protein
MRAADVDVVRDERLEGPPGPARISNAKMT